MVCRGTDQRSLGAGMSVIGEGSFSEKIRNLVTVTKGEGADSGRSWKGHFEVFQEN